VEFLGLIDTTSDYKQLYHSQFGEAADSSRPKHVTEAETILFWLAGNIADARLIDLKALAAAGDIEAMISRCQEAHLIPSDLDMPVLRRHLAVRQGILQAVVNYALPRLGIPIHLFTAALKDGADVSLGWRDVSGDYLTVIPIGGTHLSIVTPPHIQKLGQSISTVLMELRK
jgi:thioesterase domain-containing protein